MQIELTGICDEDEFEDVMETILTESALAVVQSGGESAKLSMIYERLPKDLAGNWKLLQQEESEKTLSTALGAFYIKKNNQEGGVEFYHKSFSEFLFAKRIYFSLQEWTEKRKRNKWVISDDELPKHVYDLFGYGGLTVEIVEYLRGLIAIADVFPLLFISITTGIDLT